MDIDWDYKQKKVLVSMLKYVPEALAQFRHKAPRTPQHQPYPHVRPTYGATRKYAEAQDTSEQLSKEEKSYVQEDIGTFLYYARCVDASMLHTSTGNTPHTTSKPSQKYDGENQAIP